MENMLRVGGLWRHTTQDGKTMLSGNLNSNVRIVILPNRYKQNDTQPDYVMFYAPVQRETTDAANDLEAPAPAPQPAPARNQRPAPAPANRGNGNRRPAPAPAPSNEYGDMDDFNDPFAE